MNAGATSIDAGGVGVVYAMNVAPTLVIKLTAPCKFLAYKLYPLVQPWTNNASTNLAYADWFPYVRYDIRIYASLICMIIAMILVGSAPFMSSNATTIMAVQLVGVVSRT